ncbi:MAG TPA: hypothetical protein VF172_13360 [Nitrososphaera sp.]|jgi:hypothetical protein
MHSGDLKIHVLFASPLTDMLISVGTVLIYITGLIGFVAWLERSKASQKKDNSVATEIL